MIRTIDLFFQDNACAICAYVLQGKEGLILIETGPHSTLKNLALGLKEEELDLSSVKNVLLSHIHLDHAGAAWALAEQGAQIYVHPFGIPHLSDPSKLMESARRIYQDQMDRLWGEMKPIPMDQLTGVEDKAELMIDGLKFTAYHTPGHANHHIAWEIDQVVFTGDVAGVQIGSGPVIAPLPPPDIDLDKWTNSIHILRELKPKALYLTHYGAVLDVEKHLNDLEENIHDLANWVKARMEAGDNAEEMTPKFDQYSRERLEQLELTPVEVDQYQAANPAWMSVAGLMRYWKKQNA